jgi:prevent-host-death family protein
MTSTVTAAEVSKNFGAYQDAAVREPVVITKNGRPRTVLIAYEDYVRLSKRDRRVQRTVDLRHCPRTTAPGRVVSGRSYNSIRHGSHGGRG